MPNFKEKFNIPDNATFEEECNIIIDGLGYNDVKQFIPVSKEEIQIALANGDEYLNTMPLTKWDIAAGYRPTKSGIAYVPIDAHNLRCYCLNKGVNIMSVSMLVSVLKQCARLWAHEPNG